MKFNPGNYSVELDLQSSRFGLHRDQIALLTERLAEIRADSPWFTDICSLRDGVLRYESQTLLPYRTSSSKAAGKMSVLLVLGNPSALGVKQGMFFYSRADGDRHDFWTKMDTAGLVRMVDQTTRAREARLRGEMILQDAASSRFSFGLTTFYSFPTPGSSNSPYCGAGGVERLFEPMLKHLCRLESQRLISYPFTDRAIIVFTQKSSLKNFYRATGIKPSYWPIRGEDSSGAELGRLLDRAGTIELTKNALLF
jgi:hypothetical protein